MKNIWTIIKKELARVFTDKGMILSLFLIPPLTIYLIYGLMGMSAEKQSEKYESYKATVYVINAPGEISGDFGESIDFLAYLDEFKKAAEEDSKALQFSYLTPQNGDYDIANLKKQVENEELDLVIEFPNDFKENVINNIKNNEIKLYYNINNTYSQNVYYDFLTKLSGYENLLAGTRVELEKLEVFTINDLEGRIGDEQKVKGTIIAMIMPLLLVIYLMAGAMGGGIESIAGEKERGTIATLLVTPIKRSQLAIGKVISISIIAVLSSIASFIGLLAVLPQFAKVAEGEDVFGGVNYTLGHYIVLLLIMIAAVLFFVTLIVIVSTYAKSTKQAGTLIMPLYLVVMAAAFLNMFTEEISASFTSYLIPVYNVVIALKALFQFELLFTNGLITIISTFVYTILLVLIIQKMFRSEKIMFNQ